MTTVEKMYLEKRILELITKGKENFILKDSFGNERNIKEEVAEYLNAFGEELVSNYNEIDDKIDQWFYDYTIESVNKDAEKLEEIITKTEEMQSKIDVVEKDLATSIDNSQYTEAEKNKFKETLALIICSMRNIIKNLVEKIRVDINVLTQNNEKPAETEVYQKTSKDIMLSEEDKVMLANNEKLPKNLERMLAETESVRVLRRLALNENLSEEVFVKLAKTDDVKVKEFLVENKSTPISALEIIVNDKDLYVKTEALKHKNLSEEKIKDLYKTLPKEDNFLNAIASNINTPKEVLLDICKNSENKEILDIVMKNKNHPVNNPFIEPEVGDNNALYQKLLIDSNIRKNVLVEMFASNEIFANKDGNAVFPIRDESGKMIGGYEIDMNKPKEIKTIENSVIEDKGLSKAYKLAMKIQSNIYTEEEMTKEQEM